MIGGLYRGFLAVAALFTIGFKDAVRESQNSKHLINPQAEQQRAFSFPN
jgi:hypothetical protein